MEPTDVRIVSWSPAVGDWLQLAWWSGVLVGSLLVLLVTAATVAILTRRS